MWWKASQKETCTSTAAVWHTYLTLSRFGLTSYFWYLNRYSVNKMIETSRLLSGSVVVSPAFSLLPLGSSCSFNVPPTLLLCCSVLLPVSESSDPLFLPSDHLSINCTINLLSLIRLHIPISTLSTLPPFPLYFPSFSPSHFPVPSWFFVALHPVSSSLPWAAVFSVEVKTLLSPHFPLSCSLSHPVIFLFLLIHFFIPIVSQRGMKLISSSSRLQFCPFYTLESISHPLILFFYISLCLHLFSLLVSFLTSVSVGPKEPTWGRNTCCQCLSFAYPSTLPFALSPSPRGFRFSSVFPSLSPVSVPPLTIPLPLLFPSTPLPSSLPCSHGCRW